MIFNKYSIEPLRHQACNFLLSVQFGYMRVHFWLYTIATFCNKFILQSNDKDLLMCYIKQIMNVCHSFNGGIIFLSWKIEHSIQFGFTSLNRMFNLSTQENNGNIERMANIHYLYTQYTWDTILIKIKIEWQVFQCVYAKVQC